MRNLLRESPEGEWPYEDANAELYECWEGRSEDEGKVSLQPTHVEGPGLRRHRCQLMFYMHCEDTCRHEQNGSMVWQLA